MVTRIFSTNINGIKLALYLSS